jgi:hypothetical protein
MSKKRSPVSDTPMKLLERHIIDLREKYRDENAGTVGQDVVVVVVVENTEVRSVFFLASLHHVRS